MIDKTSQKANLRGVGGISGPAEYEKTLYIGDNLPIMMGMESNMVDLIYTDPPFKSDILRKGKTPAHSFDDTWSKKDVDYAHALNLKFAYPDMWQMIVLAEDMHSRSMHNYLAFMASRIVQMHRLLKSTGSLYLHCDHSANFYLRMVLDCVFGKNNFRNEIVWCYTGPGNVRMQFPRKHDTIFFYAKSKKTLFHRNAVRVPYSSETLARRGRVEGESSCIAASVDIKNRRNHTQVDTKFGGGKIPESWWVDIAALTNHREKTPYQTQKPLALLNRIIKASSNEGDLVLDPFCGCATTCMAAAALDRQWIGIDQNEKAIEILHDRIEASPFDNYRFDTNKPAKAKVKKPKPLPKRADELGYEKVSIKDAKQNLLQEFYRKGKQPICKGCLEQKMEDDLEVDHKLARAKGGRDVMENLQLLCRACNSKKGDKDMHFLWGKLTEEQIQRRQDIINEHAAAWGKSDE